MIGNIQNDYLRRAALVVFYVPAMAIGAIIGAAMIMTELHHDAKSIWKGYDQ